MKVKTGVAASAADAMRGTFFAAACAALAAGSSVAICADPSSPSKKVSSESSSSSSSSSSDPLFAESPEGRRILAAARAEVLLGEVAERLAPTPIRAPEGLDFTLVLDTRKGRRVRVYDGEAFRRALADIPPDAGGPFVELRERAMAGALRARFPLPGTSLVALWEETALWLAFAEEVRSARVAEGVASRLAGSAPALARLLLAAGRLEDLAALQRRLVSASGRLEAVAPSPAPARRLREAARAVKRLRGNGGPSFPQEVWLTPGPAPLVARIEGEIGALSLVAGPGPNAPPALASSRAVTLDSPLLPVPGSLARGKDGQSVTWLEVAGPTTVVEVAARLDGSGRFPVTDRGSPAGPSSPRTSSRPPRRTDR